MPRLVINYDEGAPSPRADDANIGIFLTSEPRYLSPDNIEHPLHKIMIETADEADNLEHHMKLMEERANEAFRQSAPKDGNSHDENLHVIEIHPVYRLEHGNITYRRGKASGFDYSNCGFYFITAQSISGRTETSESIAKAIDEELSIYSQWCNGEIYRFTFYDDDGEIANSCGGFYNIEDIREYLPEEWKDEKLEDYIKN